MIFKAAPKHMMEKLDKLLREVRNKRKLFDIAASEILNCFCNFVF